jgi:hypothetical protein
MKNFKHLLIGFFYPILQIERTKKNSLSENVNFDIVPYIVEVLSKVKESERSLPPLLFARVVFQQT